MSSDPSHPDVLLGTADRAKALIRSLAADADSLRAAAKGDPALINGATLFDKAADDARLLLAALNGPRTDGPASTEHERTEL